MADLVALRHVVVCLVLVDFVNPRMTGQPLEVSVEMSPRKCLWVDWCNSTEQHFQLNPAVAFQYKAFFGDC